MSQQGQLTVDPANIGVETLTGNVGGPVGPSGGNINIVGTAPILVTGNPGTFTLTISDDGTYPTTFDADTGSATPAANVINLFGTAAQGLSTSAAGNTVTFTNADSSTTQKGVLELSTDMESIQGVVSIVAVVPTTLKAKLGDQTQFSMPYGNGDSAAIEWTSALTDGQIVIGATAGAPAAANITSTGGTISISNGANTINLEVNASIADTYTADAGSATPAANNLNVFGGTLTNTSGAGDTLTINADGEVLASVPTDSGTATPSGNALNIFGGTLINTAGAGDTVTINADGEVLASVPTDSGTATPSGNALNIFGGTGIDTAGAGDTVTINAAADVATTYTADSGSATPAANNLNILGGGSITTSGSGSTITISGGGIIWSVETGASAAFDANTGIFANNAGGVTLTLPSSTAVGDTFEVVAMDAAGFTVDYNTGQSIQVGNQVTTTTTGSIVSTEIGDWVQIVCNVANTSFHANVKQGNVTII